ARRHDGERHGVDHGVAGVAVSCSGREAGLPGCRCPSSSRSTEPRASRWAAYSAYRSRPMLSEAKPNEPHGNGSALAAQPKYFGSGLTEPVLPRSNCWNWAVATEDTIIPANPRASPR